MQTSLFKTAGFLTFVMMLFLNAFVDLGHKIIISNTIFKVFDQGDQIILTALVNGLILLPFILLFTPAGYISDKYPKNKIMRISAWFALAITLMITYSYYQGWFKISFALTFLLATQSALYSPAKMGFIREIVGEKHLAEGNGFVQAATMVAILLGGLSFSILFEQLLPDIKFTSPNEVLPHIALLGWGLVAFTTIELILAYRLPQLTKADDNVQYNWSDYLRGKTQKRILKSVKDNQYIWLSILGLSVFWSTAQVIHATYPAYAKEYLSITRTDQLNALLACSGIGIMIGAMVAGRFSRDHIESGLIPIGALGIAITTLLITLLDSIALQAINLLVLGIAGGLFVVPLNAYMQYHAKANELGKVIAAYNFIHHAIMVGFLILTAILVYYSLVDSISLFLMLAVVLVIGSLYTIIKLPQSLLRFLLGGLFHSRYNIRVLGYENVPAGKGVLLLGNHISWIDWALVQLAAPRNIHFVMERSYYERWYLKWFLKLFGVVPISSGNSKSSIQTIRQLLLDGKAVCLFPEGTISRTGQISSLKRGYQKAVEGSGATVIPFYLHGLWGSRFSRASTFLKENRQSGFKRDLIVAFGEAQADSIQVDELKRRIFDLSVSSWKNYSDELPSLPVQWLKTAKGKSSRMASADIIGVALTNRRFITAVFSFGQVIKTRSPEQNIGLLLPTSTAGAITNMAVLSIGKTIVNLNYSASKESVQAAIKKAEIKTIYTSSRFVKKLKGRGIDLVEMTKGTDLVYLEEIKEQLSKSKMLFTLLMVAALPTRLLQAIYLSPIDSQQTAAILFSSGSEGEPKGIELSHQNIVANSRQVANALNTQEADVIMSVLPTFHAFGLLASTLMPLSEGVPIVCHPDPTDVLNIAKGIAKYEGTAIFGTSTFLRLYTRNRRVHPLMLKSLRLVIAGAEKLDPEIRKAFQLKFNKTILEGYGATETSPVAAVNVHDEMDTTHWKVQVGNKVGSVGMPLPGTSFRIVDPVDLSELPTDVDGLILISGPQVMKGYLKAPEKTADVIVEQDEQIWYKTGDKGHLDEEGFLIIVDRYSRFAKIAGEMISLTAVENQISHCLQEPELEVVAVNLPDAKKGEKVVCLIVSDLDAKAIRQQLIDHDTNPLMIPSQFITVEAIPKLGSGKTDFYQASLLVQA
ncbi:MAG: MFS transporter [Thiotrichaceae bacterium]|nr:MFS transporter [Thiotrichaceae bacterium]